MKKLKVIDFFCGAGGFSEGFRQMGFEIVHGYDHWKPAIDTYNHNFNLSCEVKNILDFKNSIDEIEELPDTEIILGSPPCVSFSTSNKSGNADKSLGVELTETFLRIVAVKKNKPNSILKAWFMENVVNSKRYLQTSYTFKDLGLSDWATKHRISPLKIALDLYENTSVINSADYGSYQARKRVISGEIIKKQKLIVPSKTHSDKNEQGKLLYNSIDGIKRHFPNPYSSKENILVKDPQYDLKISLFEIYDHFYDTGVYEAEWKFSKYWKTNHPYMGKMSFPENENKPSRTITATKIANSRESIIYKSEIKRYGNGEYRLPTVREASMFMGFPITYQFLGSENTKWRLVGNAVCCAVSRAFAKTVLQELRAEIPKQLNVNKSPNLKNVPNLNSFKLKSFDNPPIKNKGARFRRHAIKEGNLTVTLSNYDIEKNSKSHGKWYTSIQYGTGKGFPIQKVEDSYYKELEPILRLHANGEKFIKIINNGFSEAIANSSLLQDMYEKQKSISNYKEPTILVDEISVILKSLNIEDRNFKQKNNEIFLYKEEIPVRQLFALYAINKISTKTNLIK
ncbi:DNA cytosine methyltransferase [Aestuariibaculum sediminum]|uniref:DNA (cytosine-5-)-methyltransferase n=1 Tax=Aestuariibaculum sediminum TaxID=2770637 RepID=A0A8J6Q600_9FLAO|nr:DNA (cytosine-5-)-methyltransferase [Aestuariibaculum sediminum]MBD0831303.1 DNA cytosine methyltransferase [Aestuariibaculum sediminum]